MMRILIEPKTEIEATKETLMIDVAVIIDPTRQGGTAAVLESGIGGIGAAQS